MHKILSLFAATIFAAMALLSSSTEADARRYRHGGAGVAIAAAVIGGIAIHALSRRHHRRHYYSSYDDVTVTATTRASATIARVLVVSVNAATMVAITTGTTAAITSTTTLACQDFGPVAQAITATKFCPKQALQWFAGLQHEKFESRRSSLMGVGFFQILLATFHSGFIPTQSCRAASR